MWPPRVISLGWIVAIELGLGVTVRAQVSPSSVNDCTLLPDPDALRRCLDRVEGRRSIDVDRGLGQVGERRDPERREPSASGSRQVVPPPPFLNPSDAGSRRIVPSKNVIDLR